MHRSRCASAGDQGETAKTFDAARVAEYAEVLGRCRGFQAGLYEERGADDLTFAEAEEDEGDLAELEAWVGKTWAHDRFDASPLGEFERGLLARREDLRASAAPVYGVADRVSAGSP